jgi:hypothetical protein
VIQVIERVPCDKCNDSRLVQVYKGDGDSEVRACSCATHCTIEVCEFSVEGVCVFDIRWDSPDFTAEACPRAGDNFHMTDEEYEKRYGFPKPFDPTEE